MVTQPTLQTPFSGSQGTALSPDAPEFIASPGRSRTNSLHKAKDSVSSMTEIQAQDSEPKTPRPRADNRAEPEADTPLGREAGTEAQPPAAQEGVSETSDQVKAGATGASQGFQGSVPLAPRQRAQGNPPTPHRRADNVRLTSARGGRSPSLSSNVSSNGSGGNWRHHSNPVPQQYHDANYGRHGQPMVMGGSTQGHYYQPPFGQMFPVPLPVNLAGNAMAPHGMVYPQPAPQPFILPQWQQYPMVPLPLPDQFGSQGMQPHMAIGQPLHGSFYPTCFEDTFTHQVAHDPSWGRPVASNHGRHHVPSTAARGLNAAAPRWVPEDRNTGTSSRPVTSRSSAGAQGTSHVAGPPINPIPENSRVLDGDTPGHRRQGSNSSSEREKGHRRMVSVPVDFQAEQAEANQEATEKNARSKKRGHRRQSSLPNASDMERLKEGGRKGRHSRTDSWYSNGRSGGTLENFKNNKDGERIWTLDDVKGHVIEFCKDQAGSRFIQQALDTDATPEQVKDVAMEVKHRFAMLMEDVFGNYVVQKLLERAAPAERKWMAERIYRDSQKPNHPNRAIALAKHQYGCRVVQKALETLDVEDKKKIMEQLLESTLDLVADQNGNHVIQKCIECIKPTNLIEPLVKELLSGKESRSIPNLKGEVVPLSQHMYGCRVVQRVLEHCDEPSFKQLFMVEILKDVHQLSKNIYSNYVIQHVLEYGEAHEKEFVLNELARKMVILSRDKFASNVVERCLQHSSPKQRRSIIEEFLQSDQALIQMMKDDYGNYVCFRAFDVAEEDQKKRLEDVIKRSVATVRRTSFGKNFHSRLAESHPSYFGGGDLALHNAQINKGSGNARHGGRSRSQPVAVPLVPSTPPRQEPPQQALVAPTSLLTHQNNVQRPGPPSEAPLKGEEAVRKQSTGQVSVTADGANPPVHPPMPVSSTASDVAEAPEGAIGEVDKPLSRGASQEGDHLTKTAVSAH